MSWVPGAISVCIAYTCGYFVALHIVDWGWIAGAAGMLIAGFIVGMGD